MIIHDLHWWHNTWRYLALVSGWSALNIFEQAAVNWLQTWSCWRTPESFQVCSGIQHNHEGDQREACIARNPFGTDAWRSKKHEFQNSLLQYCLPWNWSILRNWGFAGFWYLWAQQKGTGPDVELYPQKMLLGFARHLFKHCRGTMVHCWCHGRPWTTTSLYTKSSNASQGRIETLVFGVVPVCFPSLLLTGKNGRRQSRPWKASEPRQFSFYLKTKAKFQSLFYPAFLGSQHCFRFSAGRCEMLLWVCS